eukprot:201514-Rhodomonas_salina.2
MLGYLFTVLIPVGTPGFRVNCLSLPPTRPSLPRFLPLPLSTALTAFSFPLRPPLSHSSLTSVFSSSPPLRSCTCGSLAVFLLYLFCQVPNPTDSCASYAMPGVEIPYAAIHVLR